MHVACNLNGMHAFCMIRVTITTGEDNSVTPALVTGRLIFFYFLSGGQQPEKRKVEFDAFFDI